MGRKEEAFEQAYGYATSGNPESLFGLLVRDGRHKDLADFLEERWPSVEALAEEHPGGDLGYGLMANTAYAYRQLGNQARADEAMLILEQWMQNLQEQGIDNFVFASNLAELHAMNGDTDAAIEQLRVAIDGGWAASGEVVEIWPQMQSLAGDPRLAELEEAMLANINRERSVVGLEPLNPDTN